VLEFITQNNALTGTHARVSSKLLHVSPSGQITLAGHAYPDGQDGSCDVLRFRTIIEELEVKKGSMNRAGAASQIRNSMMKISKIIVGRDILKSSRVET
jgi:hypothetical protein